MAVEIDANTITTILSNINNLYSNLVIYTVGLIAFVGVLVPTIISLIQRRQFTREYDDLSRRMLAEIREKIRDAEIALRDSTTERQETEFKKFQGLAEVIQKELRKEMGVIRGNAFHLQANQNIGNPNFCLQSCRDALPMYLNGDDENNARAIIENVKSSLELLKVTESTDMEDIESSIKDITHTLDTHNTNGRYYRDINDIKQGLKEVKNKPKPLKSP